MKKKTLLLTLASSTLLLSSCGKVVAQFPDGDSALTNATIQLDHNTLNVIYDSIKNSDNYESDVNSILTSAIAKEVIGDFRVVADEAEADGYRIVLDGYDINFSDDSEVSADAKTNFINSHPAYYNWETSGYRLTLSKNAPTKEEFEPRLESIKNIIDSQIVSSLWSQANATDYKRNNRFYEVLFARNVYEQLYTVSVPEAALSGNSLEKVLYTNPDYINHYNYDGQGNFLGFKDGIETLNGFTNGALIDGSYNTTSEDGRNNIKSVLHINYYLDYINNTILPTIIENLLVEQYIFEQQYTAIGNTQSRKVNYITIADNSEKNANAFLTSFIGTYITATDNSDRTGKSTDEKFEIASTAWKGIDFEISQNADAKALADQQFGTSVIDNPSHGLDGHGGVNNYNSYYAKYGDDAANNKYFKYYKNTSYADLIEQYSTLTNDPTTNNATNYETFTTIDSHNYDPVVGFTIKADEIIVNDFTTAGWQSRDDSSLPDAIKNKLYSFGLVNDWNNAVDSENAYRGSYIYQDVNGRSYLRKDSFSSTIDSILWNDGDNYYIVEIEDIVTPSLVSFAETGLTNEQKVERENKARTIGYTLASGDTYRTNAITYYLEQCNINYHDQDVYDYFNTTYPDLFD